MSPRPGTPLPAIPWLHKARRERVLGVLALLLALTPSRASAGDLTELLAAVATDARVDVPLRADVRIECRPACQTQRAIFLARGDAVYVETRDGLRALVRADDVLVLQGTHAVPAPLDARLGDTPVLLRDLFPFTAKSLALPQVSDDGPDGVVVTSAPSGRSPYVLLVHTIDRERHVIVKTQYYTESIGHLAKIRRDGGFGKVGSHERPGEITVDAFDPTRNARLTLSWREVSDAPAALFEPGGLEHPSGLEWPAS